MKIMIVEMFGINSERRCVFWSPMVIVEMIPVFIFLFVPEECIS